MITALDLGRTRSDNARPTLPGLRVVDFLRLAIALLVVANLGRIPVLSSGAKEAPILVNDLAAAVAILAAAVVALQRRSLRLDAPALLALAFAAIGALSAMISIPRFGLTLFEFFFSIAYLVRWLFYFGIYLVVINFVRRTDVETVWRSLEWAVLVFAMFGIVQSIFLPNFAQIVYPESEAYLDWDVQGHRLVSTILDPNLAGGLIVIPLMILLARRAYGAPASTWKLIVFAAALLMTVSRSSFLAAVVGLITILCVTGISRRLLRTGAFLLLLLIPALPLLLQFAAGFNKFSFDGSALARVVSWARAFEILKDSPILGVGFNTYGFVQESYGYEATGSGSFSLDGGLIFIVVMTGAVGLILYVSLLTVIIRRCRRVWRAVELSPEDRSFALGTAASTIALVVHSIFLNSLLLPFIMEPLWIIWGISYVIDGKLQETGRTLPNVGTAWDSRRLQAV